jgi:hypothetical protein
VKLSRLVSAPVRRSVLGLILIAVVLFPSSAASHRGRSCQVHACAAHGALDWARSLTGDWVADDGPEGTVFAHGQAYAAIGSNVAAIGFGLMVDAFDAETGFPRWAATLAGIPAGSQIISVRVWPRVVTVGVDVGSGAGAVGVAGSGAAGRRADTGGTEREEFVLNAVTGKQLRVYPSALFGGAVSASWNRTIIVGTNSVACYSNATGKVIWRDSTGPAGQAWQASGNQLYVTVSSGGGVGTAPVTAVRRINMRTGDERLIRPAGQSFDGRLSEAIDGELIFSSASGVRMYSQATGKLTGSRAGAVPEVFDPVQQVLYVDVDGALIGIDPATGKNERGTTYPGPPGTYGVRDGVALGLDPGSNGEAWGYNLAKKRVIWTSRALPWPHFFVDLSGIGGSVDPASGRVLVVDCAKVGQPVSSDVVGGAGQACLMPTLVAIQR